MAAFGQFPSPQSIDHRQEAGTIECQQLAALKIRRRSINGENGSRMDGQLEDWQDAYQHDTFWKNGN